MAGEAARVYRSRGRKIAIKIYYVIKTNLLSIIRRKRKLSADN